MTFPDYNRNYDPDLYDIECHHMGLDDVDFLRKLCSDYGGPVLEICVGTGRVAIPLAYDGLKVTGLDLSGAMLDKFREKLDLVPADIRKHIDLVQADMRSFDLGKKYKTIIIAFNSFLGLTTREDQVACLKAIRNHLRPGSGRFILDIFNPKLEYLTRDPREKYQEHLYEHEMTGEIIELETQIDYDSSTQVSKITFYRTRTGTDGASKREVQELRLKNIFPDELLLLLEHCGFKVLHRWGNYEMSEFGPGSSKQLIVARTS